MRRSLGVVVAAALALPAQAGAQVSLGVRLGWAAAMGDAEKDGKLSDGVKSQVPIQLDALYAVTKDIAVGAYFSYGFGQIGDEFDRAVCGVPGVDCSARDYRLGVQGLYTFRQLGPTFVPWAGIGFGYEWGSLEAKADVGKATFSSRGFELLNLQVGGDWAAGERFAIGPFVSLSIAQYSKQKVENTVDPSQNFDGSIPDKAVHEWLQLGVRGRFDL